MTIFLSGSFSYGCVAKDNLSNSNIPYLILEISFSLFLHRKNYIVYISVTIPDNCLTSSVSVEQKYFKTAVQITLQH